MRDEYEITRGFTMMIDEGLPLVGGLLGPYVDAAKLAYGTALLYHPKELRQKIDVYKVGLCAEVVAGGTLFERCAVDNKTRQYLEWCAEVGFDVVEMSYSFHTYYPDHLGGWADIIHNLGMKAWVELGTKDNTQHDIHERLWTNQISEVVALGADRVVLEGRASGTAGIYDRHGYINAFVLAALDSTPHLDRIVIEAPQRHQQAQLIRRYGPTVGLGNIQPGDVFSVACLRNRLRGDTFDMKPCTCGEPAVQPNNRTCFKCLRYLEQ